MNNGEVLHRKRLKVLADQSASTPSTGFSPLVSSGRFASSRHFFNSRFNRSASDLKCASSRSSRASWSSGNSAIQHAFSFNGASVDVCNHIGLCDLMGCPKSWLAGGYRSEERRVGKEWRSWWARSDARKRNRSARMDHEEAK